MGEITPKTFSALTANQQEVISQIALNNDVGHNPRTLASLVRKGLLEEYEERLGGRFPMTVKRYFMPIPVHIIWCEWASAECDLQEKNDA